MLVVWSVAGNSIAWMTKSLWQQKCWVLEPLDSSWEGKFIIYLLASWVGILTSPAIWYSDRISHNLLIQINRICGKSHLWDTVSICEFQLLWNLQPHIHSSSGFICGQSLSHLVLSIICQLSFLVCTFPSSSCPPKEVRVFPEGLLLWGSILPSWSCKFSLGDSPELSQLLGCFNTHSCQTSTWVPNHTEDSKLTN